MDSRQRIIEGTRELLWWRGYLGTSPRAIQERAEVGQGSLYHHFSTKAAMATAALEATAEQAVTELEASLSAEGGALQQIVAYLRRPREVLRGCRLGQMAQDPVISKDPRLRRPIQSAFERQHDLLADTLRRAQAEGGLDPRVDPALAAAAVAAVLQGAYTLARARGEPEPFEAAITGFLMLCGIDEPAEPQARP